jgi:hypothetical protein
MKTVDPMAVFPCSVNNTNTGNTHSIMGYLSETKLHNLGTDTPSDSGKLMTYSNSFRKVL